MALAQLAAAADAPVPPIKTGLWEIKSAVLDADGKPQAPPEQAAMANVPPEIRARMAEMMKARGVPMPDANGAMKVCQSKETLSTGRWQQLASSVGCTTDYSAQSTNGWKFHSSCTSLKSVADGEVTFHNPESYSTKVTTSSTMMGHETKQTRVMEGRWLGADCGDLKPLTLDSLKAP
jgi:hypothetical protein